MGSDQLHAPMQEQSQPDEEADRAAALTFDLLKLDAAFLENPFPTYHLLRRYDPVHCNSDGSYFLTRYDDVLAVYLDRRMSSDKQALFKPRFGDGPLYRHHTTTLVFNDPPLHTRVRKLIGAAFTPRALKALELRIVTLVDGLLDHAAEKGHIDLIADYAFALPVEVICDMLGVPRGERGPFRHWSLAILRALEPVVSPEIVEIGNRAVEDFCTYLRGLITERRQRPSKDDSDVLSALIAAEEDGEKLTEEELLQNCIFLLNAGHETTTNLIGNGIDALLEYPGELARLRAEPDLIRSAVEEFLRYESSNQLGNRVTTEEVQIGGIAMPAGTQLVLGIGAANRDPAQFLDPDRLDISRAPNRHLAFGGGIHTCAGMNLARLEGQIAIGRLISRFPHLRRDGTSVRGGRARFRGYASYPIVL